MTHPAACLLLSLTLCHPTPYLQVFVWDLKPQQQQSGGGGPTTTTSVAAAAAAAMTAAPRVRQLRHHKEPVVAAGWSSNCSQLVTADKAGNVAFWQCIDT